MKISQIYFEKKKLYY